MFVLDIVTTGLMQGLILTIVAYGIMIPFRLLNFPDLTVEGAYPMGGAICASAIIAGTPTIIAMIYGIIAGCLMTMLTAMIAFKLRVHSLLAGIIVSTMAYSINLRVMGKPNLSLFYTINHLNIDIKSSILILSMVIMVILITITALLYTDFGLRLRAVGANPEFTIRQGISNYAYNLAGLMGAGALFGLAGAVTVQVQQYADINMGLGIVMHGLAGLIIGEIIIGNETLPKQLLAPLVGSLTYQQIQGLALSMGLAPSDLKLFTSLIVLTIIIMQKKLRPKLGLLEIR